MLMLAQDFRYALRLLRKKPAFTAAATLTLAIGIGANTAIFSVMDAVLLRPLPYPEANRLVRVWQSEPKMGEGHLGAAPPEFLAYRDRARVFSGVAGYQSTSFDIEAGDVSEHIPAERATSNLFEILGLKPLFGRTYSSEIKAPSDAGVAVLSYAFWRRYFAGDPNAVGRLIRLNEQPYRIIGVMPGGFTFPATAASPGEPPALWVPLTFTSGEINDWASSFDTSVIGRLRPGATLAQAEDDVKRVANEFQREHPNIYSGNVRLEASAARWSPDFSSRTKLIVWMLMAAVACVLLIACANVANLFVARAASRRRDMSVRRALGATPGRLARQVLAEAALLALGGAAAGCALAYALLRAMNPVAIHEINMTAAAIDGRALAFTFAACAMACVICGTAPAFIFQPTSIEDGLKQSSAKQPGSNRRGRSLARLLIIAELSSCVVLLIGSGLLFRSFAQVLQVSPGFDPAHTLLVRTVLNRQRYSPDHRAAVEHAIEARLRTLPGVTAVALTTHLPLADERQIGFVIDGRPNDEFHWADNTLVSPAYFRTMRIPLLRGRTFSDQDMPQSPLAAIINESMAKAYWPNEDPLGKGFRWGGRHLTVIGIAANVHAEALDRSVAPAIYNSAWQIESGASTSAIFLLRLGSEDDPMRFASAARNTIWSIDKDIPIAGFGTLRQVVASSLAIRRISLALAAGFSLVALLLSLIGVYGVLSWEAAQRVREIGVRLTLGAKPIQITRGMLGEGARLAFTGILTGICATALATKYISSLLFGIPALDPVSFSTGVLLLMSTALLASYLPARRAARVDPMIALRYE